MRRFRIWVLSLSVLLLAGLLVGTTSGQEATEEPTQIPETGTTYTVQAGDNLYRIALKFGTTTDVLAAANGITDTGLVHVGQVLVIPGPQSTVVPTETPVPTTPPEPTQPPPEVTEAPEPAQPVGQETGTYVVQAGDNLYRIAQRHNTTVAELMAINNISDQSVIYVGQQLIIPGAEGTTVITPTDLEEDVDMALADPGFDYGIEVFVSDQAPTLLAQQIGQLGIHWVKLRVEWRSLEPTQGQIDYAYLDSVVNTLEAGGHNIMLTVTTTPIWARTSPNEIGPPDDLTDFTTFVGVLAEHYAGRVDAYQIWDEPNLRRNWNCENRMCDTDYLALLGQAYGVIKAADPDALVITAGLSPTGYNDHVNAIDDRLYLETLYANGVADISDAIGVHPGGWANPPDAECCEASAGVLTHFDDDRFYFLANLNTYREIMMRYGDSETPIWVTKFGWGTSEDTAPPREINVFVTYTSLAEQASYIPRAFALGEQLAYIGPMFLDNLNGCLSTLASSRPEICFTSLLAPNGTTRPAFGTVQNMEKAGAGDSAPEPPPVQQPTVEPTKTNP